MANNKKTKKKIVKIGLVKDDVWLEPYEDEVLARYERFRKARKEIKTQSGSLKKFARAYTYFGVHYDKKKKGWWYREWAPAAKALHLTGDFNQWDGDSHPLQQNESGIWEIFIPEGKGLDIEHESRLKVRVTTDAKVSDRIPAYITRAIQDPETHDFSGQYWAPAKSFTWTDKGFERNLDVSPVIYECHTGMAQEKEGLGTYREFADNILPRIDKLGYNTIQLMAIKEHPYYGSFGYHVANFFAPSSKFGTPEDLKYLVNEAHNRGISVIMDMVHSHAVKNHAEGLNDFDGSGHQYFHEGGRGYHLGWDSKLFNYGKWEVKQFLLSNIAYWLKEFHFDGFRFDGITSMLYLHHGDHVTFDNYEKYFKDGVDWDTVTYLQLGMELAHKIKPDVLCIAEDMSGMPGMCRPIKEGGLGFDYRLGMGIPDYWIKLLKHTKDEDWNIQELWHTLSNRRAKEKTIAYSESHDQALVGDKTIAFRLMDQDMYWHMQKDDSHPVIDRGVALHKMIRFVTATLGGEGYLNFIGNEFGHPEWIDFPREGNGWSYKFARRQWSLVDREDLKFQFLNDFDRNMIALIKEFKILEALPAQQVYLDEGSKVLIFERNNLLFAFNFHPTKSYPDYGFPSLKTADYQVILNTDNSAFGGHDRIDEAVTYVPDDKGNLRVYLPSRTAIALKEVT